jgi:hypothetical protein
MIQAPRYFRPYLIALLVLLQLMAPLLHAHSGTDRSPRGLHLPGLEYFDKESGRDAASASRYDLYSERGTIVGIACGVNERAGVPQFDCDPAAPSGHLPEQAVPFCAGSAVRVSSAPRLPRLFAHALAARAPPLNATS